jgi:molybdopterin/thiamine biosynthesis adenylyltransferase
MMSDAKRISRLRAAIEARGLPRHCLDASVWLAGVGSLGSRIAMELIRMGMRKILVVDPDRVEEKDLAQGAFLSSHLGLPKVEAMRRLPTAVASPTEIQALPLDCRWLGAGVLQGGGLVISALDRLEPRLELYDQVIAAGVPFLDAGVDGHDGRITEIAGRGACYRCHQEAPEADAREAGAMAQAHRNLRVTHGCRAQADPTNPTVAAPYAINQVAAAAVGRALHVLADHGRAFEARLSWDASGFCRWTAFELPAVPTCPTCNGRGSDVRSRERVVRLEGARAGQDSLGEIECKARKQLGPGALEPPYPWREYGEHPPRELWFEQPADQLGVAYGARLAFRMETGRTVLIELADDVACLRADAAVRS